MVGFGIINPALSESANATILENDTANEVDQERTVRFRRVKTPDWERGPDCFGERFGGSFGYRIRIEHQSLILAQDERWRRA